MKIYYNILVLSTIVLNLINLCFRYLGWQITESNQRAGNIALVHCHPLLSYVTNVKFIGKSLTNVYKMRRDAKRIKPL